MKTKHFDFSVNPGLPLVVALMLALFHFPASCTKKTSEDSLSTLSLTSLSKTLNGTIISGDLIKVGNEGFMLQYGKETKIFMIEKFQNLVSEIPENIKNAEIVYCQSGLIISDIEKNKIWLYTNNDQESHKKFEMIKSKLTGSFISSIIFGWTKINLPEV